MHVYLSAYFSNYKCTFTLVLSIKNKKLGGN